MKRDDTASSIWAELSSLRTERLAKAELHAQYSLPYLITPQGSNPDREGASHDWQSVGAQGLNHLVTKLMLTLFAPSRPFMRLDASDEVRAELQLPEEQLQAVLSAAERAAVRILDQKALRPKLFEILKHVAGIGDVCMVIDEENDNLRAIPLKNYVVKRTIAGDVYCAVIRECVAFDELAPKVKEHPGLRDKAEADDDGHVEFYIKILRNQSGKGYEVTQWVDDIQVLTPKKYSDEDLPYRFLTATLPDEADYGQGIIGEMEGDFAALSTLSEGVVEAAMLASEHRWRLGPGSSMSVDAFRNSKNGDVIAGGVNDLELINQAQNMGAAIQAQLLVATEYVNRIGRAFLMSSAVTRDAERVTAEEIRAMAAELETGRGGLYSRLAVDLQMPLARFLMKRVGLQVGEKAFVPTIITGLDALSRNGDLENLSRFIEKVVQLGTLPVEAQRWLRMDVLITDIGTMEGVDAAKYVRKEAEVAAMMRQERMQEAQAEVATAAGQEQAKVAAQGAPQQ